MEFDLDLTTVRSFVVAVRTGNISRAAEFLSRTQPAISQHIQRLEEQAGHQLLRRTNTGVTPTPAGERLMEIATRILRLVDDIPAALKPANDKRPFRLGLPEEFLDTSLIALTRQFQAAQPHLDIQLSFVGDAMIPAMAEGDAFDLFLTDPAQIKRPPLKRKRVDLKWVASRHLRPSDPIALALWRAPCAWRDDVVGALQKSDVPWRIGFEAGSAGALHTAAREGLGVALASAQMTFPGLFAFSAAGLPDPPGIEVGLFSAEGVDGQDELETIATTFWHFMN